MKYSIYRTSFILLCFIAIIFLPQSSQSKQTSDLTCYTKNSDTMLTKMPIIFVGHGNPMNALENNAFTQTWKKLGNEIPAPKAILCISAHWETEGTQVTAIENPPTIHDFGGFPPELYTINYPAKGHVSLAKELSEKLEGVKLNYDWGLDHGCWSVLKFMYPEADIPVIQLSLDIHKTPAEHYAFAKQLNYLREKEILIVGSGNMVHNLRLVNWREDYKNTGYDWAIEASEKMKSLILANKHDSLTGYNLLGESFQKAIPTPEHYLPLLYVLALQDAGEKIEFYNDNYVMGSLTMTCVKIE